MKTISSGLASHFGGELTTLAVCLKMTRTDGVVMAATNFDQDLVVDGVSYLTDAGGSETDVQTSAALSVDNASQNGILDLASITTDDLHAGLYDYATMSLFAVNYSDLSQGIYRLRDGFVGQVTTERDSFVAELRGLMESLKRQIGILYNPLCPYNLGDLPFPAPGRGRCTKDLTAFTVTGTLTGVSADQMTLFDTARTEPGPQTTDSPPSSLGIAITNITTANPGHVTLASPLGLPSGSTIIISGVVGMTNVNTTTVANNVSGSEFDLPDDTSAFPSYVSGGFVTPLGGLSGYFDYGLFTVTSGANAGRSIEVKSYTEGQWTIQLPFYYPLVGNETYTMIAGCNKVSSTCKDKFDNLVNFGGFPFVPGQDKIIQVAQPQSGQTAGKKG